MRVKKKFFVNFIMIIRRTFYCMCNKWIQCVKFKVKKKNVYILISFSLKCFYLTIITCYEIILNYYDIEHEIKYIYIYTLY